MITDYKKYTFREFLNLPDKEMQESVSEGDEARQLSPEKSGLFA